MWRFPVQGRSLQEMKMSIGERLYYLIHGDYPEAAGKLTGMFLEATDSVEDLALLLFSPASLKLLLSQAFDVLSVKIVTSEASRPLLMHRRSYAGCPAPRRSSRSSVARG